jgi:hypothetical protein
MHHSAEEKQMYEDVKARMYRWLSDSCQDNLPMPLMAGYMMDRVWKEFNAAKDSYSEVMLRLCSTGGLEGLGFSSCAAPFTRVHAPNLQRADNIR